MIAELIKILNFIEHFKNIEINSLAAIVGLRAVRKVSMINPSLKLISILLTNVEQLNYQKEKIAKE